MIWLLVACRPDPGAPDYPDPQAVTDDTADADFLAGPDPYEDGEDRLSIGIFYEGAVSEWIDVDNQTAHFYIYENSFGVVPSDERVEGYTSDELVVARDTWWGGGIHWDSPRDLSTYTHLNISLRSNEVTDMDLGMAGGTEDKVTATSYGYVNDGEWHHLAIPLADLAIDTSQITIPLLFVAEGTASGDSILIDNVYMDVQ
jgi:hypothetical protein